MATITATGASSIIQPKFVHAGVYSMTGRFAITGSAGDVIQMVKVPAGFQVQEIILDMHVSTSSADAIQGIVTVGDGDDADRYMSASVSQVGSFRLGAGIISNTVPYIYTANDTIDVTIGAFTGTASASKNFNIGLIVMGSVDFQA